MRSLIAACTLILISAPALADDIGVPACDAFYKDYEACITSKIPAEQAAVFKQQFQAGKDQMKAAAATPEGKAQLEQVCTASKTQMATAMKQYGCTFQ